jgi:hypothetical protein
MLRLRTNTLCVSGRAAQLRCNADQSRAHPDAASTGAFEIGARG